jgi:hypothetical protein
VVSVLHNLTRIHSERHVCKWAQVLSVVRKLKQTLSQEPGGFSAARLARLLADRGYLARLCSGQPKECGKSCGRHCLEKLQHTYVLVCGSLDSAVTVGTLGILSCTRGIAVAVLYWPQQALVRVLCLPFCSVVGLGLRLAHSLGPPIWLLQPVGLWFVLSGGSWQLHMGPSCSCLLVKQLPVVLPTLRGSQLTQHTERLAAHPRCVALPRRRRS